MKKKVIVISTEKGIFLGSISNYAIFSKTDPIGFPKAYGFESMEEAHNFIHTAFPKSANTMFYVPILSDSDYVSVVDIIKQGYEKYTYNMMDYMPMPSEAIH
jgi:hypothetical protein